MIFRVLGCVKWSLDGTAFACGFLLERGCRSQCFDKTGLLRNALLVNQKKTGSCRCVCRKLHVERSSCDDVTCFSNGCCNVGNLVETELWLLSFCWRFLETEFPLDTMVTLIRKTAGNCRPSGPKPEIQHNQRGRGVPTLT